jgi:hypothetical protein
MLGADKLVVIGCGISEPDDLCIESDIHVCSSASASCKKLDQSVRQQLDSDSLRL